MLDNILFTANHQTITALEAPNAAACSAVHIVDTFRFEFDRTANIIVVVRIATIYDEVRQSCGTFCDGSSFEESLHSFRVTDVTNDRMTSPYQPLRHVGPHTAQSNHSELHSVFLS